MVELNKDSEFQYNQQVKIVQGFYKGYYGTIKSLTGVNKFLLEVKVKEGERTTIKQVECNAQQIERLKVLSDLWKR